MTYTPPNQQETAQLWKAWSEQYALDTGKRLTRARLAALIDRAPVTVTKYISGNGPLPYDTLFTINGLILGIFTPQQWRQTDKQCPDNTDQSASG